MPAPLNNLVVVSDLHAGCRLALCPPDGVPLDDGGTYMPSAFQKKLWNYWDIFWNQFVPDATRGEPYDIVINGDCVEGVHHRATTQISQNVEDQAEIAYRLLEPIVKKCKGRFWIIRGTEAHVGASGVEEEKLAKRLGAVRSKEGQYARYELWKNVGPSLVHLLHHVGSTGSQAYEATAVHKELVESFIEAARWNRRAPDFVVRSHRHRHIETTVATGQADKTTRATAVVTPAWQGKTPFAWKIPGARLSTPQFGGILIRHAHGETFVRSKVWTVDRSPVE
jgi:hypothetical protein